MSSKLLSMKEAISENLNDGDSLYIEGFTHLIGFSAAHEIIRQKKRNLELQRLTPDLVYDQLIEAGCAKKLLFSWTGNPGVGSLHSVRRRVEKPEQYGELELEEYSHFGMVMRLVAGSQGLPFAVLNNYQGSDYLKINSKIKSIDCPYTQKKLATVPALNPDLAIIHCQRSDELGNAQVWGLMGTQKELAFAAKKTIIVCEEIISTEQIRKDPNRTLIPSFIVDAVVVEPHGAHPSFAQGYYDRDNEFYIEWDKVSRDPQLMKEYFDEWVYGVKDRAEYWSKLTEAKKTLLKANERLSGQVNYGY